MKQGNTGSIGSFLDGLVDDTAAAIPVSTLDGATGTETPGGAADSGPADAAASLPAGFFESLALDSA